MKQCTVCKKYCANSMAACPYCSGTLQVIGAPAKSGSNTRPTVDRSRQFIVSAEERAAYRQAKAPVNPAPVSPVEDVPVETVSSFETAPVEEVVEEPVSAPKAPAFSGLKSLSDTAPAEAPAAPAVEEPVAPAVEEPVAPAVEEPVAPAVEEPVAPAVEEPVAPVVEEPVVSVPAAAPAEEAPVAVKPEKTEAVRPVQHTPASAPADEAPKADETLYVRPARSSRNAVPEVPAAAAEPSPARQSDSDSTVYVRPAQRQREPVIEDIRQEGRKPASGQKQVTPPVKPPKKKGSGVLIAAVSVIGVLIVALIIVLILLLSHRGKATESPAEPTEDSSAITSEIENACAQLDKGRDSGELDEVQVSDTLTAWMDGDDIVILEADSGTGNSDYDRVWYCEDGDLIYSSYKGSNSYHFYYEDGEAVCAEYWADTYSPNDSTVSTDPDVFSSAAATAVSDFESLSDKVADAVDNPPLVETETPEETAAAVETESPEAEDDSSDYMIPDSNTRYITEADLADFSAWECKVARNEIFARHGRLFNDDQLQAYFNEKSWYHGTVAAEDFTDAYAKSVLNDYELQNAETILAYEKSMGYR